MNGHQDPIDPKNRIVSFGDRTAYEERRTKEPIWTHLPSDFGSAGYRIGAQQRSRNISTNFCTTTILSGYSTIGGSTAKTCVSISGHIDRRMSSELASCSRFYLKQSKPFCTISCKTTGADIWDGRTCYCTAKGSSGSSRLSRPRTGWAVVEAMDRPGNHDVLKLPFSIAQDYGSPARPSCDRKAPFSTQRQRIALSNSNLLGDYPVIASKVLRFEISDIR